MVMSYPCLTYGQKTKFAQVYCMKVILEERGGHIDSKLYRIVWEKLRIDQLRKINLRWN